ncbi:Fimbrial, FimD or usher-like [Kosakonia sacchari]|nr:Fimbrial, FimD or usher-like [Kosakonia sacchari]
MNNKILQTILTCTAVLFTDVNDAVARPTDYQQLNGVMIPEAFSNALRDGMSIPLYLHLDNTEEKTDDQRIGLAAIWLDENTLKIRQIQLEEREGNASVNKQTLEKLVALLNASFNSDLTIPLTDNASLRLNFQQLILQLVVNQQALGTQLHDSSEDIGASSAENISGTLNYDLGVYNNQMRGGDNNTSSYLSLMSTSALREHHIFLDSTLYGLGSGNRQTEIYKAMYERDFAGYRFAGGMLDAWNLQSIGPVTAISSGKIYGMSWGNQANSTKFDNSHSITPVIAFLPASGEVHVYRNEKLLSVQNFSMGSHEVDTRDLPYGIYDVTVDVIVNGKTVSSNVQHVNKIISGKRTADMPLSWQVWGGNMFMDDWVNENGSTQNAKNTLLMGVSASGGLRTINWMATGYHYNNVAVGEGNISWPIANALQLNMQNMFATDGSWSFISNINATLPGGFSSVWLSREKTAIGNRLRRNSTDNTSIGFSLNMNTLWSKLGTLNASFNNDNRFKSHNYTLDYSQTLYSGRYGSLGLRGGIQQYAYGSQPGNNSTQKYIALNFSLPLGNWLQAGMTHQSGYTTATLSAQKQFDEGVIRTVGADLSRAVSSDIGDNKTLSGGAWTRYETRYSSGTLNLSSGANGYINSNLTSTGSLGWQSQGIGASGDNEGNAGVIIQADIANDGKLTANVNGRAVPMIGKYNYVPLDPYNKYEIEIVNSKNSLDSYDISRGKKSHLTLYPGNVVVLNPEIKQMVTVFGRIRAEDGTLLTNARINNHIGRAQTDNNGEFVMDIDKKFPVIDFTYGNDESCEAALDISQARGAVWVGDITCQGLKSFANLATAGGKNES